MTALLEITRTDTGYKVDISDSFLEMTLFGAKNPQRAEELSKIAFVIKEFIAAKGLNKEFNEFVKSRGFEF